MPKRSTGETPFSLVYGTEAVIPAEIRVPTHRVLAFDVENNSSALRENFNLLEERRIMSAIRQEDAKQRMEKYYNKRVKYMQFKEGDLVLRDNEASRQAKQGKLGARWEGSYKTYKHILTDHIPLQRPPVRKCSEHGMQWVPNSFSNI
ncbi:uncharacterized protein [Rutidosis leptorrhynchoides]|uniref:uncharacterized protein n=1 Tax=Rutidosis leptorrhynchoides TaxID=125765 RepID=UPI003A9A28D4